MVTHLLTPGTNIWIFGYGSLVHSPNFKYQDRVNGFIKHYRRVFYQGSTDHRGTPEAPGRTVTLEQHDGGVTWGTAFRLAGSYSEQLETLKYLEWREKQYDIRALVDIFGYDEGQQMERVLVPGALTYIASADTAKNVNYLGPAAIEDIAKQIAVSSGPSGPNYEYVYKLADSIRGMGVVDQELFDLEVQVRHLREVMAQTSQ